MNLIEAIKQAPSMRAAARLLDMNYTTFKYRAKKLGLWRPNQGGAGTRKQAPPGAVLLDEILLGLHPDYRPDTLKHRLLRAGVLKNECNECGIKEWQGKPLTCQLDHIDGNSSNHRRENLRMLCPNCHSQTPTFSWKNANVVDLEDT